jgi:hypothetical protein
MLNIVLGFALLQSGYSGPKLARDVRTVMEPGEKLLQEKFNEYQKNHDPAFVYQALDTVEAAQRGTNPGDTRARRRALVLSLHFLALLDREIDPAWNPNDDPVKGVPPPVPGVPVRGTGEIDPASIPDPTMRARYEQQLKANKDYFKYHSVQFQLRRIDERATDFLKRFVNRCYTGQSKDREEFEAVLADPALSATRREMLRKLEPAPPHDHS